MGFEMSTEMAESRMEWGQHSKEFHEGVKGRFHLYFNQLVFHLYKVEKADTPE